MNILKVVTSKSLTRNTCQSTKGTTIDTNTKPTGKTTLVSFESDHTVLTNFIVTGVASSFIQEAVLGGDAPENVVNKVLETGATVLQNANSRVTVDSISSEIQRIIDRLSYVSTTEYGQILNQHKAGLQEAMAQFLDPTRQTSVQNQVNELIKQNGVSSQQAIQSLLNDQNGPLAGVRTAIEDKINLVEKKQIDILKDLSAISARLQMDEALANAKGKLTSKGVEHELSVLNIVERFSAPLKDLVVDTSKVVGLDGTQKGDCVVQLNPDETNGANVSFVVESKDKKMTLTAALEELDACKDNRGTTSGVLVFAHTDQMPTNGVSFRLYSGNRILVARNAETNNLEMEVACNLARGLALSASKSAKDAPDDVQVKAAIEKLAAIIDQARAIEKGVSLARKGIDQIEGSYTDLRKDALSIVNEIHSLL